MPPTFGLFMAAKSGPASDAFGVGQPVLSDEPEALSDVRRADARSAQIGADSGIGHCFQVSLNSAEPQPSVLACNLLAKDDWRAALADKTAKFRPKVTVVRMAITSASEADEMSGFARVADITRAATFRASLSWGRRREGRAGAGAGPDGSVVGPSGETQGAAPDADACEEVALGIPPQIVGSNIADIPLVHVARRDQALGDQIAEPRGCVGLDLVVIGGHGALASTG